MRTAASARSSNMTASSSHLRPATAAAASRKWFTTATARSRGCRPSCPERARTRPTPLTDALQLLEAAMRGPFLPFTLPPMTASTHTFHSARDLLLQLRDKPSDAARQFRWPRLEHFNWALDHFDAMASDNDSPALWIVEADGREQRLSFAQLAERSSR